MVPKSYVNGTFRTMHGTFSTTRGTNDSTNGTANRQNGTDGSQSDALGRRRGEAEYRRVLGYFKTVRLPVLDDFLTSPISATNCVDLFEVVEGREGTAATPVASQPEPEEWYLRITGEVMAESIPDRIPTGATYVDVEGPNMRRLLAERRSRDGRPAKGGNAKP